MLRQHLPASSENTKKTQSERPIFVAKTTTERKAAILLIQLCPLSCVIFVTTSHMTVQ